MNTQPFPGIKKNISLKKFTTFRVGGPAEYFFEAKTKEGLINAIKWAKQLRLPFFVFGGGSNLLVADRGFKGLAIKVQSPKVRIQGSVIHADAGTSLSLLALESAKNALKGLEWAAGIPGTLGGAIYGNASAFGGLMADAVDNVEVFDVKLLKTKNLPKVLCKFSAKESVFKKNKNLIILSARLKLKRGNRKELQESVRKYLNYRKEKHPLQLPSAGSVFVNLKVDILKNKKIFKELPVDFIKGGIVPAGFLIDAAGLKGKRIGNAEISEKHANFIVNSGKAKSEDIKKLINFAKQTVKQKFGVNLTEEIQYLGF